MPDRHHLTLKIKSYLDALSPRAIQTLLRGLEHARSQGSADPHLDLILDACLNAVRSTKTLVLGGEPREGRLQRAFYLPIEDLLAEAGLTGKVPGRINRASLPLIWTWLSRDVAPEQFSSAESVSMRVETEADEVATLAEDLREYAIPLISAALAEAHSDDRAHQKIAMLVGGERALRDLDDIRAALQARPWLDALRESLPDRLTEWDFKSGSPSLIRIKAVMDRHAEQAPLIASVVLSRVEVADMLLSLTANLVGSTSIKKMAASSYAVFAEMAFSEVERYSAIACGACSNEDFAEALNAYCRLMKTIDRHYDLAESGSWQQRMALTRRSVSALVTRELEAMTGNVRRALLVPKLDEIGEPKTDMAAIEEAQRGMMLLDKMRDAADNLAVNEITARTRTALDQSLEIKTRALLSALPDTVDGARKAHLVAVDAAIGLCESYFGKEYADQLRRSRKTALATKPKARTATG
ncbi:hypothetical protein [Stappia stellulata]|uniref:hypothetical protein n=1 Tax=Stappia stellulata TaxID=71235 RepID=UPI00048F7430|nr:hypothetical protein [Stappia stellulata]